MSQCAGTPVTEVTSFESSGPLAAGYYRPVFVGTTSLRYTSEGTSDFAVQVLSAAGAPMTEFSKSISNGSVADQAFMYVYLPTDSEVLVGARVSSTCGSASLSGAVALERVGEP